MNYKQAHSIIANALESVGWQVSKGLKINHATGPKEGLRIWFKPQSLHASYGTTLNHARSLTVFWADPKDLAAQIESGNKQTVLEIIHRAGRIAAV